MPQPLKIDPKKDRAWANRALELAGLKKKTKPRSKATGGLLAKRILLLAPEQRIEVERLVSRLLAEDVQLEDRRD